MNSRGKICALIILLFELAGADSTFASDHRNSDECVILIHGAGRTHRSMFPLELYFRAHGYRVINARFVSAGRSIEKIAEDYFPQTLASIPPSTKVHFVAHSMGGIILRQYLSAHTVTNLGRVVMLGPPNHGSEIIDRLKGVPILQDLLGERLLELGTGADELPKRLGPATFECGVIAGDLAANPVTRWMLPSLNDGKVTIASASLEGARDFLVVHRSHTWMIWSKDVMRQVLRFLQEGKFDRPATGNEVSSR